MVLGGVTPGSIQRILLTLGSEISPSRLRKLHGMPGIEPNLAPCKTIGLPAVLLFQPSEYFVI